jgi:hypothetical protein
LKYYNRNFESFKNNFIRRKLREVEGDFTNDFLLRNQRYKDDLKNRLPKNDKFLNYYYKFFKKANSFF